MPSALYVTLLRDQPTHLCCSPLFRNLTGTGTIAGEPPSSAQVPPKLDKEKVEQQKKSDQQKKNPKEGKAKKGGDPHGSEAQQSNKGKTGKTGSRGEYVCACTESFLLLACLLTGLSSRHDGMLLHH